MMAAPCLIIDGYNLLHAAGMARAEYGPGDLQRCRTRLLRYLVQRLSPAEIVRATIVFDARDPPADRAHRFQISGLTVLFANPGGDADVAIERLIEAHQAPQQIRLISSDRRLQLAARAARAQQESSADFLQRLERRLSRTGRAAGQQDGSRVPNLKGTRDMSVADTAEWLAFFGIANPADLLAELDPGSSLIPRGQDSTPAAEAAADGTPANHTRDSRGSAEVQPGDGAGNSGGVAPEASRAGGNSAKPAPTGPTGRESAAGSSGGKRGDRKSARSKTSAARRTAAAAESAAGDGQAEAGRGGRSSAPIVPLDRGDGARAVGWEDWLAEVERLIAETTSEDLPPGLRKSS